MAEQTTPAVAVPAQDDNVDVPFLAREILEFLSFNEKMIRSVDRVFYSFDEGDELRKRAINLINIYRKTPKSQLIARFDEPNKTRCDLVINFTCCILRLPATRRVDAQRLHTEEYYVSQRARDLKEFPEGCQLLYFQPNDSAHDIIHKTEEFMAHLRPILCVGKTDPATFAPHIKEGIHQSMCNVVDAIQNMRVANISDKYSACILDAIYICASAFLAAYH